MNSIWDINNGYQPPFDRLCQKVEQQEEIIAELNERIQSLEKSITKIEQRSISNRNKIRDLSNGLLNLDNCVNYSFNSIDHQISELYKIVKRLSENTDRLWWYWVVAMTCGATAFILSMIMWFR